MLLISLITAGFHIFLLVISLFLNYLNYEVVWYLQNFNIYSFIQYIFTEHLIYSRKGCNGEINKNPCLPEFCIIYSFFHR